MRRTATTANAILGLLALRDEWSTWDLRNQMRRNMRFFWPRAESRILAELRALDRAGLASARHEMHGRRRRTCYSITASGRRHLEEWLAAPARATTLECEPLLRVMLGALSSPDRLRAAVDQVALDAREIMRVADVVAAEYLAGTAPFQDHVAHRALVFDFLTAHARTMADWATRTSLIIERWPGLDERQRTSEAIAHITARHHAVRGDPGHPPTPEAPAR